MSSGHTESKDVSVIPKVAAFYKVTFGPDLVPVVTALDDDAIWDKDKGGLDCTKPFVVCNPGNISANKEYLAKVVKDMADPELASKRQEISDVFATRIAFLPKIFERGIRRFIEPKEKIQYLATINETGFPSKTNMELIKQHNANPDNFTTPYAMEQARLIYGPLITENGISRFDDNLVGQPLPAKQIIENLSKARSYNVSFGTVTANCQMNALVRIMRALNIPEETIKTGIEGMRRVDGANMAKASWNGIFPSTIILGGSNDLLVARYEGNVPPVPEGHVDTSVILLDDHRIRVYQTLPIEIYNPGKKPNQEEKAKEDAIRRHLPDSFEAKVTASNETIKNKILGYLELDGFRIKDPDVHDPVYLTCEATPGNEVQGRDPDLLYKFMADMMIREDSMDVLHYFQRKVVDSSHRNEGLYNPNKQGPGL